MESLREVFFIFLPKKGNIKTKEGWSDEGR
jgi:hypothetical protein